MYLTSTKYNGGETIYMPFYHYSAALNFADIMRSIEDVRKVTIFREI